MIWDQSHETLDRDTLRQLQLERLQSSLFRAYRNVSFYRASFDAAGIVPEDIQSLDDLASLPFTTRQDLQDAYPYNMLAVPLREVVRLHNSSWAAGQPAVCAYTRNDLRHWHDLVARTLSAGGITRDDVVQILFDQGSLTDSLGFHGGAERIGASVIPLAPTSIAQQINILQDYRTTALVGSAGEAAHLAWAVHETGIDIRRFSLRVGLFGAEPWSEASRQRIEQALGIVALDSYGISELFGPGLASECEYKHGLHLAEDHLFAEIVDPGTGKPVAEGEEGELVITTLTKEALPLIRYRTRDLTRLTMAPCECGRTLARIARVRTRADSVVLVRGRKIVPEQLAGILTEIEGTLPHFQLTIEAKSGLDAVELMVELLPGLSTDSVGKILAIEQCIGARIHEITGISPHVRLVEPATITRATDGQAFAIVDRRG